MIGTNWTRPLAYVGVCVWTGRYNEPDRPYALCCNCRFVTDTLFVASKLKDTLQASIEPSFQTIHNICREEYTCGEVWGQGYVVRWPMSETGRWHFVSSWYKTAVSKRFTEALDVQYESPTLSLLTGSIDRVPGNDDRTSVLQVDCTSSDCLYLTSSTRRR